MSRIEMTICVPSVSIALTRALEMMMADSSSMVCSAIQPPRPSFSSMWIETKWAGRRRKRTIKELISNELFYHNIKFIVDLLNIRLTPYWARWRLKTLALRSFALPFVQAQIKEIIKAPRRWPLWVESTGDQWIPLTKGHLCRKCFHLMTSTWNLKYNDSNCLQNINADYKWVIEMPFFKSISFNIFLQITINALMINIWRHLNQRTYLLQKIHSKNVSAKFRPAYSALQMLISPLNADLSNHGSSFPITGPLCG